MTFRTLVIVTVHVRPDVELQPLHPLKTLGFPSLSLPTVAVSVTVVPAAKASVQAPLNGVQLMVPGELVMVTLPVPPPEQICGKPVQDLWLAGAWTVTFRAYTGLFWLQTMLTESVPLL